jgi:hypothetical protein
MMKFEVNRRVLYRVPLALRRDYDPPAGAGGHLRHDGQICQTSEYIVFGLPRGEDRVSKKRARRRALACLDGGFRLFRGGFGLSVHPLEVKPDDGNCIRFSVRGREGEPTGTVDSEILCHGATKEVR